MDQSVLMASLGPRPADALEPAMVGAESFTDAEVMLKVKAGDQSAFDFLVHKYRRVYRSRGSYEATAKFTTWLYRIATNLAVNHARDTRKERPEVTVSLDEQDDDTGTTMDVADGRMSAEEALVRRERMLAIRSKVEALPERQRLAVIMHKYQQMDYKQIAEVLKLSESATKSLLFMAYETLREQLKEFV
jgi:RNA polymerase sigma-70 factor (ECF subfamily)